MSKLNLALSENLINVEGLTIPLVSPMEMLKSKLLEKRLELVKMQKEALFNEEARLLRMARQGRRGVSKKLAIVKREKNSILAQEARILRVLKQGTPAL